MQDVFLLMVTPPTTLHLFHALELIKSNRECVRKAREAYLQHPCISWFAIKSCPSRIQTVAPLNKSQKTLGTRLNSCKLGFPLTCITWPYRKLKCSSHRKQLIVLTFLLLGRHLFSFLVDEVMRSLRKTSKNFLLISLLFVPGNIFTSRNEFWWSWRDK